MYKTLLISVFISVSVSVFAQNRLDATYENRAKLFSLAQTYVDNNADDTESINIFNNYKKLNEEYTQYLNKVSGGSYSHFGTGSAKFEFEKNEAAKDQKVVEMRKSLNKTRKLLNQHFSEKDPEFKLELTNFLANLKADVYGPAVFHRRS